MAVVDFWIIRSCNVDVNSGKHSQEHYTSQTGNINMLFTDIPKHTVSPIECERNLLCCICYYIILVGEFLWIITHVLKGCLTGIGTIVWLPRCQCIYLTATTQVRVVCIFLGILYRKPQDFDSIQSLRNLSQTSVTLNLVYLWPWYHLPKHVGILYRVRKSKSQIGLTNGVSRLFG